MLSNCQDASCAGIEFLKTFFLKLLFKTWQTSRSEVSFPLCHSPQSSPAREQRHNVGYTRFSCGKRGGLLWTPPFFTQCLLTSFGLTCVSFRRGQPRLRFCRQWFGPLSHYCWRRQWLLEIKTPKWSAVHFPWLHGPGLITRWAHLPCLLGPLARLYCHKLRLWIQMQNTERMCWMSKRF